jgi:hypothetical protein
MAGVSRCTTRVRAGANPSSCTVCGARLVSGRLKITKSAWASSVGASYQARICSAASEPSSNAKRWPGKRLASSRTVSIVYETFPRSISSREATSPGCPVTASSTIRIRSWADASGGSLRCGGLAFGINHTWSRSATWRSWRAAAR